MIEFEGLWHASVTPSPLDDRVWVVVIPDTDTYSGAMHASTSLRRCKAYAEEKATAALMDREAPLKWVREGQEWVLVDEEES